MEITGLILARDWRPATAAPAPPTPLPDPSVRILDGDVRRTWLDHHLDVLRDLSASAGLDIPTLRRDALVVRAHLPPRALAEPPIAGPPDRRVLWAAPTHGMSATERQAVQSALLEALRRLGIAHPTVIVDCAVGTAPAPLEGDGPAPHPQLRLEDFERAPAEAGLLVLGTVMRHAGGDLWVMLPYRSDDESRDHAFAASVYAAAGILAADIQLVAAGDGRVHAAYRLPEGLETGMGAWKSAAIARDYLHGIGIDALVMQHRARSLPYRSLAVVHRRIIRLGHESVLGYAVPPASTCNATYANVPSAARQALRYFATSLHPGGYSDLRLRHLFGADIRLDDVVRAIQRALEMDTGTLHRLSERFPRSTLEATAYRSAVLASVRNALGGLSFLERAGQSFHERGTSPREISGKVVWSVVDHSVETALRPQRRVAAASARTAEVPEQRSPHQPTQALVDVVRDLLRDPEYLSHPMDRGGMRLIYPIPGHPYLFKLNFRAAESVVRWRARYGGGEFPDHALAVGQAHVDRLEQRHCLLADRIGPHHVYPELHFIAPEVTVPGQLLNGLAEEPELRQPAYTLPILGSIQRVFPHFGLPGTLEYHVPYAELELGHAALQAYKDTLDRLVLNLPPVYGVYLYVETFMRVHPSSSVASFLERCRVDEAFRNLAHEFFSTLITQYCADTRETLDTAGSQNAFWYTDESGEPRLAVLDWLYPQDAPLLAQAEGLFQKFLRAEPFRRREKTALLNAINFARGVNFMAYELNIPARIELVTDTVTKLRISNRFTELLAVLSSLPAHKEEPHPDEPWGRF